VLSYFQLFIFEVICRKSEMLRLYSTNFGDYGVIRQVDAATLARLIYTPRLWRF